eukprot:768062-Hanusia_phi.AAC.6
MLDLELDRRELVALEVGSDWGHVHQEGVAGSRGEAEDGSSSDDERADVERSLAAWRDPVSVCQHTALDALDEGLLGDGRHTESLAAIADAPRVLVRAENDDPSILRPLGLHALKDSLPVVQDAGPGRNLEGSTVMKEVSIEPHGFLPRSSQSMAVGSCSFLVPLATMRTPLKRLLSARGEDWDTGQEREEEEEERREGRSEIPPIGTLKAPAFSPAIIAAAIAAHHTTRMLSASNCTTPTLTLSLGEAKLIWRGWGGSHGEYDENEGDEGH